MKGYGVALIELMLFFVGATLARSYISQLQILSPLMYYWFCFTTLTGLWEYVFVTNYTVVVRYSRQLVANTKHVWDTEYPWFYIRPDLMAKIFYAEYGAWADREYMSTRKGDYWSRLIESSHALCCGAFCCATLLATMVDKEKAVRLGMVGMGMQFMNSLLYMGQYFLQCRHGDSPNYNNIEFPLGRWMSDRLFMWVNIFWMICPTIIIFQSC